jgi:adenine-specific DNA-methyltransferase
MPPTKKPSTKKTKEVTRYVHEATDPATPETGHTGRLVDEKVVTLEMDNGWGTNLEVARIGKDKTVVVDIDPGMDPVLLWAGKRNRREVPVLPLQRNEIVSESRIARIVERARSSAAESSPQGSLFGDLDRQLREAGKDQRVEFYTHEEEWRNKLICGDSLEVMESLIRYEGMAGEVQMIYIDPPYGIAYDSNFQQRIDATSNSEEADADDVLTIKAFSDTWTLGVHSYLSYLTERLYLCRELLADSGSVFVQISLENVALVRLALDEVFGRENFRGEIAFVTTTGRSSGGLDRVFDVLLLYSRSPDRWRYNQLFEEQTDLSAFDWVEHDDGRLEKLTSQGAKEAFELGTARLFAHRDLSSQGESARGSFEYEYKGKHYRPPSGRHWSVTREGLDRLAVLGRLFPFGVKQLRYKVFPDDDPLRRRNNLWLDTQRGSFSGTKDYVVETPLKVIERCVALTTAPGELVFDPTCGSGTTAVASEKLGRRWVTCDTSRVATNVARRRLLSASFDNYVLLGPTPSLGMRYRSVPVVKRKALAYDLEPAAVPLIDQPEVDSRSVRICGPFEVMTLGRYSLADWRGGLVSDGPGGEYLEDYVTAICRLYDPNVEVGATQGLVHAMVDAGDSSRGISVGPLSGRVSANQLLEASKEAADLGLTELDVLGWAFESNIGEIKDRVEAEFGVKARLVMIRPDALAEGLKVTQPGSLFSPLTLPEVRVNMAGDEVVVELDGATVFDRKTRTTAYHGASDGYITAWYLDENYDGDCFVDSQMFFDFKRVPNLRAAAGRDVEGEEFALQFSCVPFKSGSYRRIAVKVVDVFGNESTIVRNLES